MTAATSVLTASLLPALMLFSGCAGRTAEGVLIAAADTANFEGTSRVTVLAATTRQRSNGSAGEMFTGRRGDGVTYASITVSIPPDNGRKIGEVQWPTSLPGDPRRDFVTTSANYIGKKEFTDAITADAKLTKRNKVLVFVHGFNSRFDDAVYRFAQIVHDANASGIPVLFSWPSRGELNLRAYTYDRESANYSRDALEALLDQIASNPNIAEINIVAHSMGNWVTLESLRTRSIETQRAQSVRAKRILDKVKNVLLVAPDVDIDVFRTQIARIGIPRPRIAVFVSQDDKALALSKTIWGGMPRLGDIDPTAEPYRSEFERDHIEVFNLTKLKSANAHNRAFEDVTTVVEMMRQRFDDDQKIAGH
jgi:esterase/lipase superfamily enzyme